jgi:hypothetical protein
VLVADPLNLHAVGRVFAAKGREIHRSLPMLINGTFMAEELARDLSTRFHVLARHFWPGPLTMILPASAKVPLKVTGNTGRLAIRQSRSRVAQALLDWLDQPLIATSANISGQPTCRSGIDVFGVMDGGWIWSWTPGRWPDRAHHGGHYRAVLEGDPRGSDFGKRNRRVSEGRRRIVARGRTRASAPRR